MALFNKLFTNRCKNAHTKHQDNVSEKLFAFSKDQVRVVLFRECDFRGRKLLFDSSSVKKIPINDHIVGNGSGELPKTNEDEKITEIADGFGYIYTKREADCHQLAEMVFGSVAMSFRGTYFKMHNLDAPNRLMFTQVFSSPRHATNHNRMSISSRSSHRTTNHNPLEHSQFDDSGASSANNSLSEHLSVYSTASDTILVCRRQQSAPLDMPNTTTTTTAASSISIPSLVGDSGYCPAVVYDQHSATSSGPLSSVSTTWSSIGKELNCGGSTLSLCSLKKTRRKTSFSFGQQMASSSASILHSGHHHRNMKLGLAFIVQLTNGQEEALGHFFMEHVSLLESMLWRARQVVEKACCKSQTFTSMMMDMVHITSQYLVNLLSGSYLSLNLWLTLSSNNGCDNYNSIHAFSASLNSSSSSNSKNGDKNSSLDELNLTTTTSNSDGFDMIHSSNEFNLFKLSRFLKSAEWDPFNLKKNFFYNATTTSDQQQQNEKTLLTAEKFLRDFCELLELIDVKDTNFFMSTLLTAVLTHHLGWVNTCLPNCNATTTNNNNNEDENDDETDLINNSKNPLWNELSDLYGAIGHPTKMAQTIIIGANRKDLVSKILLTLTYFIRGCDVEKRVPIRVNIEKETDIIETLCRKQGSIPKENFKKYEDHLKEIMNLNNEFFNQNNNNAQIKCNERERCQENGAVLKKTTITSGSTPINGLQKTKTCIGNLCEQEKDEKCEKLIRISSTSSALNRLGDKEQQRKNSSDESRNVVFVLGESDKLIGLKKSERPNYLNLHRKTSLCSTSNVTMSTNEFKDDDFVENSEKSHIKPSTSWSNLVDQDKPLLSRQQQKLMNKTDCICNKYARSQSVPPPEERKSEKESMKNQSKYRYSGVKFNLQQHPQILSNYMKSKNLEMSNLQFGDKGLKIDELSSLSETIKFPEFNVDYEESEALQTPSNASELEFTSDLFEEALPQQIHPSIDDSPTHHSILSKNLPNTTIVVNANGFYNDGKMRVALLPMPQTEYLKPIFDPIKYTSTLMRASSDDYMPDMVLQAPNLPKTTWESKLKSDLALASQHSLLDQPVDEAVAVLANTDSWEVQLMSSHTFVIDKGSSGIRVGMSQLVSNMLESLLQMWKLNVSPHYCLMHIEHTLQELCIRSKALAELLLATEFCSMEQLTSTLHLEVNDVPLLLAVASTHSPQVTQKYGLSFQ